VLKGEHSMRVGLSRKIRAVWIRIKINALCLLFLQDRRQIWTFDFQRWCSNVLKLWRELIYIATLLQLLVLFPAAKESVNILRSSAMMGRVETDLYDVAWVWHFATVAGITVNHKGLTGGRMWWVGACKHTAGILSEVAVQKNRQQR